MTFNCPGIATGLFISLVCAAQNKQNKTKSENSIEHPHTSKLTWAKYVNLIITMDLFTLIGMF